ncbi:MAG: sigma 54-interacting transcriptional regulator [Desulfohalobiaceae bacterium]|nr:sigma 54-interacting transcriptional regulator [Desulfohalobiaceae bacterium]
MQNQLEMYELILDSIYNGVMITDDQGRVTHMNKPYGEFLGLDHQKQIGKHCTEVVENSRMHIVARSGKPEINDTQRIMGQNMVVQRIPIRKDGRVVAVYGQVMFKDIRDVSDLASRLSLLQSKVEMYEQELINLRSTRYTFASIVGVSPAIHQLKQGARKAAESDSPVCITGESGTGKEVFAQAIHQAGPRRMHPFVRINCAAIPRDLLESELFGYAGGAFTGALAKGKPGKFELGNRGTVFLDEIGELPLEMQPKLLQALEEKEFERIGGTKLIKSDFRVIAATNQDLEKMIKEHRFRKDLYYRLNVIPMFLPPLRERKEDIIPLAGHILRQFSEERAASRVVELSAEVQDAFQAYQWPGNVRELANVLERILSTMDGEVVSLPDCPLYLIDQEKRRPDVSESSTLRGILEKTERETICRVLRESRGNKLEASRRLGIHRTHLYKKLQKYSL